MLGTSPRERMVFGHSLLETRHTSREWGILGTHLAKGKIGVFLKVLLTNITPVRHPSDGQDR
jgi:hypothetical protein